MFLNNQYVRDKQYQNFEKTYTRIYLINFPSDQISHIIFKEFTFYSRLFQMYILEDKSICLSVDSRRHYANLLITNHKLRGLKCKRPIVSLRKKITTAKIMLSAMATLNIEMNLRPQTNI